MTPSVVSERRVAHHEGVFTRIQSRSFRCLKAVDQRLGPFQALVGPNASGKTTFLDVVGFLSDLMRNRGDVRETAFSRSQNFDAIVWMARGAAFQLAVEADIPRDIHDKMADDNRRFRRVRYEVEVGLSESDNEVGLNHEILWLIDPAPQVLVQRDFFPELQGESPSLIGDTQRGRKRALSKSPGQNDNYYPEGRTSYIPSFKLGRGKSALAHLPADDQGFPVSAWFRDLLEQGVQPFVLDSRLMRQPSPPGLGRRFQTNGSNLPWVVAELRNDEKRFAAWLDHVRTALEDIQDVNCIERAEDKHRYLVIEYKNGAKVPSWLVSDGTLRLLALTIPAYLSDLGGAFLIEEPENGVHPKAIETVLQSLSSIYDSQVLVATHSPVALNILEPAHLLCFAKDANGATDIVSGDGHPTLRDWRKGEPDLGALFASGILS